MTLFEAVPNFSEGRDPAKIARIAEAGRSVPGTAVLDVESNPDHHRSVISIVGDAEPLLEALFRMVKVAVETIDLNQHVGEHPRMGAADVVPIVPLEGATIPEAVALSERLAQRVWTELGVPVYLYAQSARRPEREDLGHVRRGGFEGIRDSIGSDPDRVPDVGEARVHATAGIVAIGARPVLIAYNAYLTTPDVSVAKRIAKAIRERDGGLPAVKALGFDIRERHQAQVSMNLTDYHRTPIHSAFEAVGREAAKLGSEVEESEIVGLVPEDALLDAAVHFLKLKRFDRGLLLERKIRQSTPAGSPSLADVSVREFASKLSARTPTPGGGSASALSGGMAAALGEMVVRYSRPKEGPDPELDDALVELGERRVRLIDAVDADARSFEEAQAAKKERKAHPDVVELRQAHRAAVRRSAELPLGTARECRAIVDLLERIRARIKPSIASDLVTAIALARAAIEGAAANARINLAELAAEGIDVRGLEHELAEIGGKSA